MKITQATRVMSIAHATLLAIRVRRLTEGGEVDGDQQGGAHSGQSHDL